MCAGVRCPQAPAACSRTQLTRRLAPTPFPSPRAQTGVLSSITALRKLINHPKLIADVIRQKQAAAGSGGARGGGEAAGRAAASRRRTSSLTPT